MSIAKAHGLLGHVNKDSVRETARHLQWTIVRGKLKPCKHCAKSKAKQKNICKESKSQKAEVQCGRVYLDLSKVTVSRDDGTDVNLNQKRWKSIVDERTGKKWCGFTATNKEIVERTCEWLNKMKTRGIVVEIIRLDPTGKNLKLEKRVASVDWQAL